MFRHCKVTFISTFTYYTLCKEWLCTVHSKEWKIIILLCNDVVNSFYIGILSFCLFIYFIKLFMITVWVYKYFILDITVYYYNIYFVAQSVPVFPFWSFSTWLMCCFDIFVVLVNFSTSPNLWCYTMPPACLYTPVPALESVISPRCSNFFYWWLMMEAKVCVVGVYVYSPVCCCFLVHLANRAKITGLFLICAFPYIIHIPIHMHPYLQQAAY
jgi:hypothetical protein